MKGQLGIALTLMFFKLFFFFSNAQCEFSMANKLTFTCSKSTIETLEEGVKYVQG